VHDLESLDHESPLERIADRSILLIKFAVNPNYSFGSVHFDATKKKSIQQIWHLYALELSDMIKQLP
jgi:hypothetical protein